MGIYNPRKDWLERAVTSALGLFDEIIFVDDASTVPVHDYLVSIIGGGKPITDLNDYSWVHKDGYTPLKFIRHETNKGFHEAKNTATKAASGDVIATLDWDDYFDRGGVGLLKEFSNKNEGDVYHFQLQMFGTDRGIYGGGAKPEWLTSFNSIPGISWFKKSMWEAIGGFTYDMAEDWDFWLRAFKAGYKFSYFPGIVYYNNRRPDSRSASWTGPKFDEIYKEVLKRNGY